MENKFYTDGLERLVKEKSDEFRMYPSRRVWHSIYNDRHPSRRWPSVAISMILIFVLLLVGYLNTSDTDISNNTQLAGNPVTIPSEATSSVYNGTKRWKTAERKAYTTTYGDDEQAPTANAGSEDAAATTFIALGPPAYSVTDEAMTPSTSNEITSFNQGNNNSNYFTTGIDAAASGNISNKNEITVRNNPAAPGQRNNSNPLIASGKPGNANNTGVNGNTTSINPAAALNNNTRAIATAQPTPSSAAGFNKPSAGNNRVRGNNANDANLATTGTSRNNTRRRTTAASRTAANGKTTNDNSEDLAITADPSKKANTTSALHSNLKNTGNDKADDKKTTEKNAAALTASVKTGLSEEEKSWIDDFVLHNKPLRKKWKDVVSMEFYAAPSLSYRSMSSNVKKPSASAFANNDISDYSRHKPGIGLEAGVGVAYAFAKRLRFKAGVQFNYTNFGIKAGETSHPSLVSLLLNDPRTGYAYSSSRTTSLSNGIYEEGQPVTLKNKTYQVSVPLGLAVKLAGNKKMEWFAGATIQPSYVFGGDAYLLSSDLKNYVNEPQAIRRWNFNTGIETYVNYKVGKTTSFQAGPQFRYQLQSTFKSDFTTSEKLYNIGLKIGLVKNF